jgi:methylmalonyl-CoA mutase C-terminal domain/subunit
LAIGPGKGSASDEPGQPSELASEAMSSRVLVAKIGLDGHDRGVKVVARILRDAGYEVVYTGLFQTPATVVAAAIDEDVDAIGLSMLSGAHLTLVPKVCEELRARGTTIPVIVGGIVPDHDVEQLLAAGVARVLTPGASADEVVEAVRSVVPGHPNPAGAS